MAPKIINTIEKPSPIIKPSNADLPQVFLLAKASARPKNQGTLLAILPPGAFIGLGLIVALKNWIDV
jgi:Na+-translocating ferredoxin:NAD+ oxidoreductase RnfE subunit